MLVALFFLVFSAENSEADEAFHFSVEGDNGLTSYSSQYGEAYYNLIISTGSLYNALNKISKAPSVPLLL